MLVSKTISIDIEDLIMVQNLVYKNDYSNVSQFVQQAVKNQINTVLKD